MPTNNDQFCLLLTFVDICLPSRMDYRPLAGSPTSAQLSHPSPNMINDHHCCCFRCIHDADCWHVNNSTRNKTWSDGEPFAQTVTVLILAETLLIWRKTSLSSAIPTLPRILNDFFIWVDIIFVKYNLWTSVESVSRDFTLTSNVSVFPGLLSCNEWINQSMKWAQCC